MDGRSDWDSLRKRIVSCSRCPRLRAHGGEVARVRKAAYRDFPYWGKPVPNFGDQTARVLIVGLAPGAHGANRTGRMFTGDRSGDFLYRALHETGFAESPVSRDREDGQALIDCAITAVVHCAPPGNRPTAGEIANCLPYLSETARLMPRLRGFVALGGIAFDACVRLFRTNGWLPEGRPPRFGHGAFFSAPGRPFLLASYHPSQQNTFTGRLTMPMLVSVLQRAALVSR
jgi:uracil-DNA glycosylase family 4